MRVRYNPDFYNEQSASSRRSAQIVVPLLLDLIHPESVLDVGCGVGTWLSVFQELGVSDVVGMDGSYVRSSQLQIDPALFRSTDVSTPFLLGRRFDLVVSVEVAEHLPSDAAPGFVESLTAHGPAVLFSAAIPLQGGTDHVNEQWPRYWVDLFDRHGFVCADVIRPMLWADDRVDYWYAQNMLLFVKESELRMPDVSQRLRGLATLQSLAVVHPGLHLARAAGPDTSRMSLTSNLRAIRATLITLARLVGAIPSRVVLAARRRLTP